MLLSTFRTFLDLIHHMQTSDRFRKQFDSRNVNITVRRSGSVSELQIHTDSRRKNITNLYCGVPKG